MGKPGANGRVPRDGEEVQVECWCQRSIVWARIEEVRAGRTQKCFRTRCEVPTVSPRRTFAGNRRENG